MPLLILLFLGAVVLYASNSSSGSSSSAPAPSPADIARADYARTMLLRWAAANRDAVQPADYGTPAVDHVKLTFPLSEDAMLSGRRMVQACKSFQVWWNARKTTASGMPEVIAAAAPVLRTDGEPDDPTIEALEIVNIDGGVDPKTGAPLPGKTLPSWWKPPAWFPAAALPGAPDTMTTYRSVGTPPTKASTPTTGTGNRWRPPPRPQIPGFSRLPTSSSAPARSAAAVEAAGGLAAPSPPNTEVERLYRANLADPKGLPEALRRWMLPAFDITTPWTTITMFGITAPVIVVARGGLIEGGYTKLAATLGSILAQRAALTNPFGVTVIPLMKQLVATFGPSLEKWGRADTIAREPIVLAKNAFEQNGYTALAAAAQSMIDAWDAGASASASTYTPIVGARGGNLAPAHGSSA